MIHFELLIVVLPTIYYTDTSGNWNRTMRAEFSGGFGHVYPDGFPGGVVTTKCTNCGIVRFVRWIFRFTIYIQKEKA